MATSHPVRMRIIEVRKKCPRGHKVGDEWLGDGATPGGICMGSFGSCLPYLTALRFGASFPWEWTSSRRSSRWILSKSKTKLSGAKRARG
jgi:uncharacterized repeat protein (TIGR04076 family)